MNYFDELLLVPPTQMYGYIIKTTNGYIFSTTKHFSASLEVDMDCTKW